MRDPGVCNGATSVDPVGSRRRDRHPQVGTDTSREVAKMLDQILVIVGVTFLVMLSPGPDMVLVLRNTFMDGRLAGLHTSLGVLTGNLVHISYCVLGIGWLIAQSILAFTLLKYAGAAYLTYLGIMSFRSGGTRLEVSSIEARRRNRSGFAQGFVNNLLNPKGALFYLGVFTLVITPETSASATLVLILCMMFVSAAFWLFFVYTLDRPAIRRFIERSQRVVNRIFGVLLVFLAIRLATLDR
jgi:RhtB (resistance to homoserine/threonine) family protein